MTMWATVAAMLQGAEACVLLRVVETHGSTPRGTDAWMVVSSHGFRGSVGGGTLEWMAMAEAQRKMQFPGRAHTVDYALGPDLGQCCGGRVKLSFEAFSTNDLPRILAKAQSPHRAERTVFIFGAGHVGRALAYALAPFPFDVRWVDPRPDAFPATLPANATKLNGDNAVSALTHAPAGAMVFVMSHSHALDQAIVDAALRLPQLAAVGVIGSATKRARFQRRLAEAGIAQSAIETLICPIGIGGITSKLPAAIAASVAAQVLQLHEARMTADLQKAAS
jgi:xanthine dehydrogenase accessory factor